MHTANMKWWQKAAIYVLAGFGMVIYAVIWPFIKAKELWRKWRKK